MDPLGKTLNPGVNDDWGVIPAELSGPDSILWCYQHALLYSSYYFGISNSNQCVYMYENARFDSLGLSSQCNLPCGIEKIPTRAICGGLKSYSVYQVEVRQCTIHSP